MAGGPSISRRALQLPISATELDRDGVKQFFGMFLKAFPHMHFHIEDPVAEGDRVVARVTMHGTHEGEFMVIPPTGKEISVKAIDILRFADGKAVEHWGVTDQVSMMEQLGVGPTQQAI